LSPPRRWGNAPWPEPPAWNSAPLCIRGVQILTHVTGEGIERNDFRPGSPPALANGGIFPAPEALLEGAERGFAGVGVDGFVNALERSRHRLAVFPGDEIEAVAQKMNDDAGLNRGLRIPGGDGLWKALQAVDHGDQHILDTAVLQLVHDAQPELGAFVLFEPEPGDDRLLAITISPVAWLLASRVMAHLGVENPFRQGFLQIIDEPVGLEGGLGIDPASNWSSMHPGCGVPWVAALSGSFAPIMPNLRTKFLTLPTVYNGYTGGPKPASGCVSSRFCPKPRRPRRT
jgi:hypothetical protein